MANCDDDDEPITLSAHALAALAQFNQDKDAHRARVDELQAAADRQLQGPLSMEAFAEDWNESQFWYSDETAHVLASQLLHDATGRTAIGVVSTPSVFVALRNALRSRREGERPRLVLLEHDDRFAVFPEFVSYDFQQPLRLPGDRLARIDTRPPADAVDASAAELKASLDRVICDPPFLSQDCQTKTALTVRWLLKTRSADNHGPRVIVCTGERMQHIVVAKLYRSLDVRTTTFEPKHARGLGNEFYCYANFECPAWKWRHDRADTTLTHQTDT